MSVSNTVDPSTPSLVNTEWLKWRLGQKGVKLLDASWYMPAQARDGLSEFKAKRIPGARYFHLDEVAEPNTSLPHMLPSEQAFAAAMDALDITNADHVVVYDGLGIFSSPRAWWTFKCFGHERVSVLEGGLPSWESSSGPVSTEGVPDEQLQRPGEAVRNPPSSTRYKAKLDRSKVRSAQEMLANVGTKGETVVDARSPGRFVGKEPEPRHGLKGGHIPGAHNVPFPQVLKDGKQLKSPEELERVFSDTGVDVKSRPVVGSCGSGLTACILALAIHQINGKVIPIYDGSWSEWGMLPSVPISTESPSGAV